MSNFLQGNKKQVSVFSAISMVVVPICHWVLNLAILISACAGERDEKLPTSGAESLLVGGEIWRGGGGGVWSFLDGPDGGAWVWFPGHCSQWGELHCLLFYFFLFLFYFFQPVSNGRRRGGEFRWWEVVNLTGTCIRDLLPEIRVEVV